MKTLILAMAAVMTLGAGAAFAGEGSETATQAQWDLMNGIHSSVEQQAYGNAQAPAAQAQAPQRTSIVLSGSGWNSNG